uniref:AN1-type domain-containing protein n=1 Tax=Mola mola TaxID=94237 RepID=A0A3Q4A9D7_MOLML
MGDTGSEGSKPPSNVNVIPPRCPFLPLWKQQKQPDDCAPKNSSNSESSQADIYCNETNGSISQLTMSKPSTSEDPSPGETGDSSLPVQNEVSSTDVVFSSLKTPTKRSFESASESENDVSPEKRARVSEVPESEDGSKQRSRKRCYRCQTKLELVQQELGSCRCGFVFCMLHRLPEQHDCPFDHLGHGRQEAVLKMVKLDRKVGRSCQRIGEECS